MDSFSKFHLYKNVEEVLEVLNQHKTIPLVLKLLQLYEMKKENSDKLRKPAKHPLIVLEGLDGSGKTSMTKQLAKRIHGITWRTPPESTILLREYFDSNATLRTAYYSLGNYIAALEVSCQLHMKPIVMDRFWHSTTAFALAQSVTDQSEELPDPSDEIYKWPADLLKPDKVILLNVSEQVRLERHSRRGTENVTAQEKLLEDDRKFRENVIQAYKNMREPSVDIVNGDESFMKTVYLLLDNVKPLLK